MKEAQNNSFGNQTGPSMAPWKRPVRTPVPATFADGAPHDVLYLPSDRVDVANTQRSLVGAGAPVPAPTRPRDPSLRIHPAPIERRAPLGSSEASLRVLPAPAMDPRELERRHKARVRRERKGAGRGSRMLASAVPVVGLFIMAGAVLGTINHLSQHPTVPAIPVTTPAASLDVVPASAGVFDSVKACSESLPTVATNAANSGAYDANTGGALLVVAQNADDACVAALLGGTSYVG